MKHRKGSYRFDVGAKVKKIEADAWENARAMGFKTFAQVSREMKKPRPTARRRTLEWDRYIAVLNVGIGLGWVEHVPREVESMLALAAKHNKNTRETIAKLAARDSETRDAKAA